MPLTDKQKLEVRTAFEKEYFSLTERKSSIWMNLRDKFDEKFAAENKVEKNSSLSEIITIFKLLIREEVAFEKYVKSFPEAVPDDQLNQFLVKAYADGANPKIIRFLIQRKADVLTPIHRVPFINKVCLDENAALLEVILAEPGLLKEVEAKCAEHQLPTPLFVALESWKKTNKKIIELLIAAGSSLTQPIQQYDKLTTVVHSAFQHFRGDIGNDLLDRLGTEGIDRMNALDTASTLLHEAIRAQDAPAVNKILEAKSDLTKQNSEGYNCLHVVFKLPYDEACDFFQIIFESACKTRDTNYIVKLLIQPNTHGKSVLDKLMEAEGVFSYLISKKTDIEKIETALSQRGTGTFMHFAIENCRVSHYQYISSLLKANPKFYLQTSHPECGTPILHLLKKLRKSILDEHLPNSYPVIMISEMLSQLMDAAIEKQIFIPDIEQIKTYSENISTHCPGHCEDFSKLVSIPRPCEAASLSVVQIMAKKHEEIFQEKMQVVEDKPDASSTAGPKTTPRYT